MKKRNKLRRGQQAEFNKEYYRLYPDRVIEANLRSQRKATAEIRDSYLKRMIRRQYGIKAKDVPIELLNAMRESIKFKRLIKQIQDESKNQDSQTPER